MLSRFDVAGKDKDTVFRLILDIIFIIRHVHDCDVFLGVRQIVFKSYFPIFLVDLG